MHESKSKLGLVLIGVLVIVVIAIIVSFASNPLSDPNYLNLEYFFNKVLEFFRSFGHLNLLGFVKTLLSLLAIIFITVIIYTRIRLREMQAEEHAALEHAIGTEPEPTRKKNDQWDKVLMLGNSTNPSDWRFAIIEADTILDEMLKVMGYHGETLAERLKTIDPADYKTLDFAWDAHKVRNKIAHEGIDFKLDRDETHRVLGFYERVFKEFDYI